MIPFSIKAKLVSNRIPQVTGEIRQRVLNAVNQTAYEVASIAYQLSPVDTGNLRSTIAVEAYNRGELLRVIVTAEYAGFVEYGTRFSEAQPFLRPAIESVKSRLNRKLGQIVKGLGSQVVR